MSHEHEQSLPRGRFRQPAYPPTFFAEPTNGIGEAGTFVPNVRIPW